MGSIENVTYFSTQHEMHDAAAAVLHICDATPCIDLRVVVHTPYI